MTVEKRLCFRCMNAPVAEEIGGLFCSSDCAIKEALFNTQWWVNEGVYRWNSKRRMWERPSTSRLQTSIESLARLFLLDRLPALRRLWRLVHP